MKILDIVIGPLVVLLLLAISLLYTASGNHLDITRKLIRWVTIFAIFSVLFRMCVPHGWGG